LPFHFSIFPIVLLSHFSTGAPLFLLPVVEVILPHLSSYPTFLLFSLSQLSYHLSNCATVSVSCVVVLPSHLSNCSIFSLFQLPYIPIYPTTPLFPFSNCFPNGLTPLFIQVSQIAQVFPLLSYCPIYPADPVSPLFQLSYLSFAQLVPFVPLPTVSLLLSLPFILFPRCSSCIRQLYLCTAIQARVVTASDGRIQHCLNTRGTSITLARDIENLGGTRLRDVILGNYWAGKSERRTAMQ